MQKRHLDRRICQAQTGRGLLALRRRRRSVPPPLAPHLDDLHRVHRGCVSVGRRQWCRCRNAPGHGCRRVLRHDWRHALRVVSHTRLLRDAHETWLEEETRPSRAGFPRFPSRFHWHRCRCCQPRAVVQRGFHASRSIDDWPRLQGPDQCPSCGIQRRGTRQLENRPAARQRSQRQLVGRFQRHQLGHPRIAGLAGESGTQSRHRARGSIPCHRPRGPG